MKKTFYFVILLFTVISCTNNEHILYQENASLSGQWNKDKKVSFGVKTERGNDSILTNIFLNVRHNHKYPYKNIWLLLQTDYGQGFIQADTLEYYLAANNGKWLGVGMGSIKENLFVLKYNKKLKVNDSITYTLKHGMRVDDLEGIEDLTLIIEKIK